jgi:chromosome segregation ATPase
MKKQNELRIESIILEDFKSYGGKKVIGPLD